MINTLLEHVPIKMENKDVDVVNNDNEEHIKDDDDVVNSEEEDDADDDDDDEDPDDDEDEEEEDEDDEEEDLESDALEVEQEVTLLMSSDEEAELEAQRIRFPEKRPRKKSQDSKSSRCTSRNSNTSQASSGIITSTLKENEQKRPAKEKEATDVVVGEAKTQPQRTSPRNRKENNKNLDNLPSGDLRQVSRRQSNNSTCSVASSIASDSAETESCANIYVYQQQLIFNCEFCDLKYGDLENLSCHLNEAHRLFHNDEDQEKENSPRNMRNKGNQLPTKQQHQHQQQQQALSVKKEHVQTTDSTSMPPAALSLDIHSDHALSSCGNVFILNHRKLFLICGHCESKYANVELFEKHLRQQHDVFEGRACNEVNVVPKTEVKEEVFIITEVVEKSQIIATSEAMVTIPAEIPLDVSTTEDCGNETEMPLENEVISSIQIHDSGVTVAEIPVLLSEEASIQIVVLEAPTTSPLPEVVEEVEECPPPSTMKKTRKRRSSPAKPETPKSPYKRPRRNVRKTIETEPPKPTVITTKPSSKRKTTNAKKEDDKPKETQAEPSGLEKQPEIETTPEEQHMPIDEPMPQAHVAERDTTMTSTSTPIATATATATKRKRKPLSKQAKVEKDVASPPTPPPAPTVTKPEVIVRESLSDRDEEFLEDPVAEIIEQIQNEMNCSSSSAENRENQTETARTTVTPSTLPVGVAFTNVSPLSPNIKPILCDLNSPVDIKPILHIMGERRFVCDQCPRSFKKNVRLVEHKRLHTGEKPFICDECGKKFRIRMQLNEHKLRHSKQKKFICDVCNLGCCTKQDLNLHMRHHTNDRRFHCTMCPKAFVRNSDLKIHVRVHTGEKPYICDICHKCFRANQNLSVHKKSHMGEASRTYKCEHCDKKFMRNIDRTVHMRSHTGEKPFKCEICDRAYSSKFNVRAHIERDHISENGKKKPGPKPKALREELAKQKKLIEELQHQLMQQIKTDEKIIPAEHSIGDSGDDETSVMDHTTSSSQQNDSFIISEINSPTSSIPLTAIPSPPGLDNPFAKAKQKPTTVVPLTITQKIEQHSASSASGSLTPSPAKATTTKVVQQKTSLGIQQVSVTVSMQVENVSASSTTPEKENAGISNLQLTTTATSPATNSVKKERKITSYFTVVGQKAEV